MRTASLSRSPAPTFLESFEPHAHVSPISQSRGGYGGPGVMTGASALSATGSLFGSQAPAQQAANQIQRFTYWDYVAINLVAQTASEVFPMLSYQTTRPAMTGGATQSFAISGARREWIQQHYGWLQSAQDDLNPLPENHRLHELFNNPNPDDTWNEFAYEHFMFLDLTGRVYWWVIPDGFGLPAQMVVVPTQWIREDFDSRTGELIQYIITVDGSLQSSFTVPAKDIIMSRLKSPKNKRDGYSPTGAAPLWSENVKNIEGSRYHSFKNGANPDLIIELGEKYADPTEDLLTRVKEKFMRRASGIAHVGEPLITPPDAKVNKWSNTPKEMAYLESGDQARDNNLALHGVPKVLAGITTDINRATVEGADVIFCAKKINPRLRHYAGTLTWLARRFDPRIKVWFQDCTPKNAAQELLEDQADFSMGAITPDERRQKRGRKPLGEPAYESGYLPAGLSPLAEELQAEDPAIDPVTGQPVDPNADAGAGDSGSTGNTPAPKGDKKKPAKKAAGKSVKQSTFTDDDFDAMHNDPLYPV